ncbi:MAG: hypothetical protein WD672_00435 [Woeseia sp.]
MDIKSIKNHRYVKLVEFVLANQSFSVRQACDASGLSEDEFSGAKYSLFMLKGAHERIESSHEILDWRLKPEAYFSYVSYLEFKHSLATSRRAWWFSVLSLLIAAASLLVAGYGTFWK